MAQALNKEYAGITGLEEFTKQAAILAYGKDSAPLKEGRVSQLHFLTTRAGALLTISRCSRDSTRVVLSFAN